MHPRFIVAAATAALIAIAAGQAVASRTVTLTQGASKQAQIHEQQQRYYHADGYLKAIGKVAHRTIYSSDPATRRRWRAAAHWLSSVRADALAKLRALTRPAYAYAPAGFPPHHALWLCISGHEGGPTSVNPNGHYGMLQMSYNWLGLIRGRASDYPQSVQEWAAERGYRAAGYSRSFLYGQWLNYDGAYECLGYA